jgi:hypothetical protein
MRRRQRGERESTGSYVSLVFLGGDGGDDVTQVAESIPTLSKLGRKCHHQRTQVRNGNLPPSTVGQLITHSPTLIVLVTSYETVSIRIDLCFPLWQYVPYWYCMLSCAIYTRRKSIYR